jgi:hypothetical protein
MQPKLDTFMGGGWPKWNEMGGGGLNIPDPLTQALRLYETGRTGLYRVGIDL